MQRHLKDPWIPQIDHHDSASLRLFCFPYAGAGILSFRGWRDRFPDHISLYPVELPGRGFRIQETPMTELKPLVEAIGRALYPYLDRPFAFFGHSMGALISFELAQFLRQQYRLNPVRILVSGRCAPHFPPIVPPIHHLPKPEFLAALRDLNGTPKEVFNNPELLDLVLPILRADFTLVETYFHTPKAPLDCPISIFGGLQDPETTVEGLEAWQAQTSCDTALHLFPGDHFFMYANLSEFLTLLHQDLDNTVLPES